MQLTKNFNLSEFQCKSGEAMPEAAQKNIQVLADNLQVLRDYVNKPIKITSGYRSPAHNKAVGGAEKSKHMVGIAADIKVKYMQPQQVADVIEQLIESGEMLEGGIGIYKSWVHYDIFYDGVNKRRW